MQIDDDLAVVWKHQRHHAPHALVIDVGTLLVIDAIAGCLHPKQQRFRTVHKFCVSHYNFTMLRIQQILVSLIVLAGSVAGLCACGQQGALYLPNEPIVRKPVATPTQPPSPVASPLAPATPSIQQ